MDQNLGKPQGQSPIIFGKRGPRLRGGDGPGSSVVASRYPHPLIAREGWFFVGLSLAISVLVGLLVGWWWSVPVWLLAIFILQFFRDPPREVPADPGAVLSAADGRVVEVSRAQDPYVKREALKVSVFMNVFNVHSNRSPVDGVVKERW